MSRKKYTLTELEGLIKQARQAKNKPLVQKYRTLYRHKLNTWAAAWQAGRAKLLANQQTRRQKKAARLRVQQAKQEAKQQKKTRLQEIYSYFRQELNKPAKKDSPYFTPHLDLPPYLASYVKKLQRQHPDYDPWKEFSRYKIYRLNKAGKDYLFRQTNQAYTEELADQDSQLRYYKDKIGSLNLNTKEFIKSEQFKYFFPEPGEHKDFWHRRKEFRTEREQILTEVVGQRVKNRTQLLAIYKRLYAKSPWRIRDRFLVRTEQPGTNFGMGEIWQKYWKNNTDYPFSYSRKHYMRAIGEMLRKTEHEGELVPDSEIELDKYGNPKFKEGQVIVIDSNKPGRSWSVYKKVPSLEKQFEKEIHFKAQADYINEYGTELEKDIFFNRRRKKFLCVIEAMGFDCRANQGTSEPWCFLCIQWGNPYHPPVLPIHCPWRYTFKTSMCGSVEHREANKQWHWSLQGEKTNVAGKDWGSCHVGRYDYKKRSKR